uniref:Uncharacterized protein n=1 Tax=Hippocampus comes TaxID=109280 RepID=A0A3Q2Z990_HIPCM
MDKEDWRLSRSPDSRHRGRGCNARYCASTPHRHCRESAAHYVVFFKMQWAHRLKLLVWVETRLTMSSEVAKHLEGVSVAALIGVDPVLTWRDTGRLHHNDTFPPSFDIPSLPRPFRQWWHGRESLRDGPLAILKVFIEPMFSTHGGSWRSCGSSVSSGSSRTLGSHHSLVQCGYL